MRITIAMALAVVCGPVPFAAQADDASYLPGDDVIPDLTQTDAKGHFANGGRSFCGPVAVSNSFMAMFGEDLKWEGVSHYDLANQLASRMFMNTDAERGTNVRQLLRGVELYLAKRGEKEFELKFQGWRGCDFKHRSKVATPRLSWIQKTLASGGAVWLNVGWYRYDAQEKNTYKRIGGHWVTAVGYGQDAAGTPQPDCLVIHDPAPRAGTVPSREFVRMTPLESGKLDGVMRNLPFPARGFYRMEGGMHVKKGADLAILDGAVGLRLAKTRQVAD